MHDLRDTLLTHLQSLVDAAHAVAIVVEDRGADVDVIQLAKALVTVDALRERLDALHAALAGAGDPGTSTRATISRPA
jgi:hypothetical protein